MNMIEAPGTDTTMLSPRDRGLLIRAADNQNRLHTLASNQFFLKRSRVDPVNELIETVEQACLVVPSRSQ